MVSENRKAAEERRLKKRFGFILTRQLYVSQTHPAKRTTDYIRGSTSALEVYKKMPTMDLQQMVEEWRKTSTQVEKAATAEDGDKVEMPPTKRQATEPATEQAINEAELYRASAGIHE